MAFSPNSSFTFLGFATFFTWSQHPFWKFLLRVCIFLHTESRRQQTSCKKTCIIRTAAQLKEENIGDDFKKLIHWLLNILWCTLSPSLSQMHLPSLHSKKISGCTVIGCTILILYFWLHFFWKGNFEQCSYYSIVETEKVFSVSSSCAGLVKHSNQFFFSSWFLQIRQFFKLCKCFWIWEIDGKSVWNFLYFMCTGFKLINSYRVGTTEATLEGTTLCIGKRNASHKALVWYVLNKYRGY